MLNDVTRPPVSPDLGANLQLTIMQLQDLQERFEAELKFAAMLCGWHPEHAGEWQPLIDEAAGRVAAALASGNLDSARAAVAAAEQSLSPIAHVAKTYTIYAAGHGHIDMNWMWSWPETVAVTNDTFTTVLKLMDEFPQFHFSQSQASTYAIIEEHNPALLARIAERVREGRWEVTASHWVENDNNMAGPESLFRHLLYTREYMQQLFGLSPEDVPINWCPDTFGHAVTLPSYLVRGGVKYMYLHRPGAIGPARPDMFWWQAPDGARVLVRNDMIAAYNGVIQPDVLLRQLSRFVGQTGLRCLLFVYGVGDHGGGPTRRDIVAALEMDTWPVFPNLKLSTTREFFERVEREGQNLPVLDVELNTEFTGCYTTQTLIKHNNRFAENHLADAEVATSLAWLAFRRAYPSDKLRKGWRDTLFSHFHDILPGSGVHDTRTFNDGQYQQTMATTSMLETLALRQLASHVDTCYAQTQPEQMIPASRLSNAFGAGVGFLSANGSIAQAEQSAGAGDRPFVVFNPLAWERNEVIETTVWDNTPPGSLLPPLEKRTYSVRTPDGQTFAPQLIDFGHYWGHRYVRFALPVQTAGVGYAGFAISETAAPADETEPGVWQLGDRQPQPRSHTQQPQEGLENDLVRVELDTTWGGIRSLVDKRSGTHIITPGQVARLLEYAIERPNGMTAWVMNNAGPVEYPRVVSITRKLRGPFKATIEVKLRIHESDVTLTYELRAGDPQLYLHLTVVWFQRGTPETGVPRLQLAVPLALTGARGRYEIPFGAVDRDLNEGEEVPALQWAQVTGEADGAQAGCLLLNDSKYGYSLDGSTLRMTLIRSSYMPDILPEVRQHEINAALVPFAGDMPVAEAVRLGRNFNHALRVIGTDVHSGLLPATATVMTSAPDTLILNSIKKAEADDALVVTFFDPTGAAADATVTFNSEIVGQPATAVEVDLLERPTSFSTAVVTDSKVSVHVPERGIAAVKVGFGRS